MKTRFTEKDTTRNGGRIQPSLKSGEGVKLEEHVIIRRPAAEIYSFWRRFENLSRFMRHIESVTEIGGDTSHWVLNTSQGKRYEWDARLIEDKPGQMISWQSLEGADVDNAGSVWFIPTPDGAGTEVKVSMKYSPPGGRLGAALAKLFGASAEQEMREDLNRLKTLLESGAIPPS